MYYFKHPVNPSPSAPPFTFSTPLHHYGYASAPTLTLGRDITFPVGFDIVHFLSAPCVLQPVATWSPWNVLRSSFAKT